MLCRESMQFPNNADVVKIIISMLNGLCQQLNGALMYCTLVQHLRAHQQLADRSKVTGRRVTSDNGTLSTCKVLSCIVALHTTHTFQTCVSGKVEDGLAQPDPVSPLVTQLAR